MLLRYTPPDYFYKIWGFENVHDAHLDSLGEFYMNVQDIYTSSFPRERFIGNLYSIFNNHHNPWNHSVTHHNYPRFDRSDEDYPYTHEKINQHPLGSDIESYMKIFDDISKNHGLGQRAVWKDGRMRTIVPDHNGTQMVGFPTMNPHWWKEYITNVYLSFNIDVSQEVCQQYIEYLAYRHFPKLPDSQYGFKKRSEYTYLEGFYDALLKRVYSGLDIRLYSDMLYHGIMPIFEYDTDAIQKIFLGRNLLRNNVNTDFNVYFNLNRTAYYEDWQYLPGNLKPIDGFHVLYRSPQQYFNINLDGVNDAATAQQYIDERSSITQNTKNDSSFSLPYARALNPYIYVYWYDKQPVNEPDYPDWTYTFVRSVPMYAGKEIYQIGAAYIPIWFLFNINVKIPDISNARITYGLGRQEIDSDELIEIGTLKSIRQCYGLKESDKIVFNVSSLNGNFVVKYGYFDPTFQASYQGARVILKQGSNITEIETLHTITLGDNVFSLPTSVLDDDHNYKIIYIDMLEYPEEELYVPPIDEYTIYPLWEEGWPTYPGRFPAGSLPFTEEGENNPDFFPHVKLGQVTTKYGEYCKTLILNANFEPFRALNHGDPISDIPNDYHNEGYDTVIKFPYYRGVDYCPKIFSDEPLFNVF